MTDDYKKETPENIKIRELLNEIYNLNARITELENIIEEYSYGEDL